MSGHDEPHGHEHSHGIGGRAANILRPHSHDHADSIDRVLIDSKDGVRAVKISLAGLGATAAFQLVVVAMSGSVALLADTIHNFGDAITAVPLWLAFVLGVRASTRRYAYGYGRAEDLAGVFVVLMIAASAGFAGYESVRRLVDPRTMDNAGWVALAGFVGFLGNEGVAQYRIRVGRRIGSAALVADGYHARTDGFTSLAVIISAAAAWLGFGQADPLIGLVITVAILFVLKDATVQMWHRLMDAVDPEILSAAEAAARTVDGVVAVSVVRPRWIGHAMHAEVRVTVDRDLSVAQGHEIADAIEHAMMAEVPKLRTVIVHLDPCGHGQREAHADQVLA